MRFDAKLITGPARKTEEYRTLTVADLSKRVRSDISELMRRANAENDFHEHLILREVLQQIAPAFVDFPTGGTIETQAWFKARSRALSKFVEEERREAIGWLAAIALNLADDLEHLGHTRRGAVRHVAQRLSGWPATIHRHKGKIPPKRIAALQDYLTVLEVGALAQWPDVRPYIAEKDSAFSQSPFTYAARRIYMELLLLRSAPGLLKKGSWAKALAALPEPMTPENFPQWKPVIAEYLDAQWLYNQQAFQRLIDHLPSKAGYPSETRSSVINQRLMPAFKTVATENA